MHFVHQVMGVLTDPTVPGIPGGTVPVPSEKESTSWVTSHAKLIVVLVVAGLGATLVISMARKARPILIGALAVVGVISLLLLFGRH